MNEQFRAHYEAVKADEKLRKPDTVRRAILLILLALTLLVVFVVSLTGFVFFMLDNQKNTEEYAVSYDYLVSSQTFRQMDVSEEAIRLNSFRTSSMLGGHLEESTRTAEFGFTVSGTSFKIVCHLQDELWQVCRECTHFE